MLRTPDHNAQISAGVLLLVASLSACSEEGNRVPDIADRPSDAPATFLQDSAGATHVINRRPAWDERRAWRVSNEPILTIGAVDGDDPYLFTDVADQTRLADGRIVMVDAMTREIRAFSPESVHLWTRGGPGEGPWELSSGPPFTIDRLESGMVQVASTAEHVRYDRDGALLDDVTIDWARLSSLGRISTCRLDLPTFTAGSYLMVQDCPTSPKAAGLLEPEAVIVAVPPATDRLDTIARVEAYPTWAVSPDRQSFMALRLPLAMLWGTTDGNWKWMLAVGGSPVRLAYARFDRYRIYVFDVAERALLHVIERPDNTRPPTRTEIDSSLVRFDRWTDGVAEAHSRRGIDLSAYRAEVSRAREVIPDSISTMDRLVIDRLGYLWVADRLERGRDADTRRWAVFRDDGVWLGEVATPASLTIHEIGSDYILGATHNEVGVPFITLLALDRTPG